MKTYRIFLIIISILAGGYSIYLSNQVDLRYSYDESQLFEGTNMPIKNGISIDSAKDGASGGFAILSGLSLIALSITYLKK